MDLPAIGVTIFAISLASLLGFIYTAVFRIPLKLYVVYNVVKGG